MSPSIFGDNLTFWWPGPAKKGSKATHASKNDYYIINVVIGVIIIVIVIIISSIPSQRTASPEYRDGNLVWLEDPILQWKLTILKDIIFRDNLLWDSHFGRFSSPKISAPSCLKMSHLLSNSIWTWLDSIKNKETINFKSYYWFKKWFNMWSMIN